MASPEAMQDTIEAALTLVGGDGATIERSPSSTIVPAPGKIDTAGQRAFDLLGRLDAGRVSRSNALELHGTIGEGGMGVVRLATQHALGREVAVKTLKEDHRNEHSTLKLLREAWVTGGLEHPNVVPVYDIALEPDGSPLIVLKKIEGDEWAELMHDSAAVQRKFGAEDLLEWNLRTLMQVCHAVRFAHSRRILHRDLKPENVMIGAFGEVYLVDWGIALSLDNDSAGWLPLAKDATEMAGTPLYMAPEMLGGPVSKLSERTDVYLLGALLYEIVTGDAPHRGETLMEIVASIVESQPLMPEDVPQELVRIIRRAMDADPDARFENSEQLRLAVQGFLQHRDASRLAERAEQRSAELRSLLEAHEDASDEDGPDDVETRESIYRVFGESRFGFRHALEVWPGNDAAREALDRTIELMVSYELSLGQPEAARALLTEIEAPTEGLTERVEAARRDWEREDAELRRVSADQDPSAGRRTRMFVSAIVGTLWVLVPLVTNIATLLGAHHHTFLDHALFSAGFLVLLMGLGYWARESMMRTAINRRVGAAAVLWMGAQLASALVGMMTDQNPSEVLHQSFLAFSVIGFMLAVSVDKRLALAGLGYLACYIIIPLAGFDYIWFVMTGGNLLLLVITAWAWFQPDDLTVARDGLLRRRERRREFLARHLGRGD